MAQANSCILTLGKRHDNDKGEKGCNEEPNDKREKRIARRQIGN
jgi:hypothetical protein